MSKTIVSDATKQNLIQQIAKKAGFTTDHVNALIYGTRPPKFNDKHMKIIQELNENGQGVTIGMIWKGKADPGYLRNTPVYHYLGHIIEGLNLNLHKHRYTSRLFMTHASLVDENYLAEIFSQHPNAGIINFGYLSPEIRQIYTQYRRPIVFLDYPADMEPGDSYVITSDVIAAYEEVIAQLYNWGHRRMAFIAGPPHKASVVDRYRGYCSGLAKVGLPLDDELVTQGDWYEASGEVATQQLLALASPPTVIISANDLMALGAINVIHAAGLTIPDNISIIGYNDVAAAAMSTPPLSSIRVPKTKLGTRLGDTIVALMEGETPTPRQSRFLVEIVHRDSTGPARQ